jgi:hypothetical protein
MALKVGAVVLVAVMLSGCDGNAGRGRADAAIANGAQSDGAWRSTEGYQQARWGMTPAEVQKAFAGFQAPDAGRELVMMDSITAGRESTLGFVFFEDRLAAVVVRFRPRPRAESYGDKVLDLLVERYGTKVKLSSHYSGDELDVLEDMGVDLRAEGFAGVEKSSGVWDRPESRITFIETWGPRLTAATIVYASKQLFPSYLKARKTRAAQDL